ncbi:FtsK/SpoIIIE family DNA translocase [Aurantibacillus circumpalustris]|uniref:FtsK/SpoIIIE family DNA translocase n=1 Tax=Aurantibacillus circumpalustris TaxID=3036359 RepID=UPI00295AD9C1|nr:DNA translocase FtsK 4TM domain-containing protein [Aurantibacillus circumpalustris]
MAAEKKNKFRGEDSIETLVDVEERSIERNDIEDVAKKTVERKNKPKNTQKVSEPKPENAKTVSPAKQKVGLKTHIQQFLTFYNDERTQKIVGLLLILFSAYLTIAFVSYFSSWDVDQDKVLGDRAELFLPETKVKNWLGKFGAIVSHLFMYKGFGASSFILVPVLCLFGLQKVVQRKLINVVSFNAKWLFIMVWSSLALAYIFSDKLFFMGGGFGYFMNAKIANYVGGFGLGALIIFSMLTFLVLSINLSFKLPARASIMMDEETEEEMTSNFTSTSPAKDPTTAEFNSSHNELNESKLTPEEEAELLNFEVITKNDTSEKIDPLADSSFEVIQPKDEVIPVNENQVDLTATANDSVDNGSKGEPELEIAATVNETDIIEDENKAEKLVEQFGEYDPTLDLGSYKFPHFDLLNDYGSIQSKVNQDELIANKNKILGTLKNYGIEIDKIMATVGPTVTLYEIVPAAGVRISKIKNLEDDIALSLAALGIRIIAPIPGKGTIGIEVPNQTPEMVPMKNILASEKFNNSQFELPIALGKTISNEIFIADLAKMPHLLMAGATGQGKSVGLNAVLVSLLYKKHPAQVKFVLVDPKKVELTLFNKIERHFLAKLPNSEDAIITDNTKVIHTLNSLCIEMDNRYALLQDAQVRNIKEYNTKFINRKLNPNDGHKYLPYIVLVVDEFADLIMTAGKEVETPIARLAQLARAIGIHLIIATQRPSVNIITGTIKANFPARIAFRVSSKIDSRTILDSGGADQLIGRGDMLLSTGNDLIRIQCAFVDTPEVEKITEFIGNQRAYPSAFLLPEYVGEDGESGKDEVDLSERDKMFDDAAKLVVQFQQGSASFLQRKLKLGYNRAGRIVDQLEAAGFIGPFEGSKAREVLVKDMAQMDEILQKIKNR